jgi:hypothetical protein
MKKKFNLNRDLLVVLNIYTIIVFSGWLIGVYYNYSKDINYLQEQVYKDSNVIKFLLERLSNFEEMVISLNNELDEKERYIAELESQNKMLKDLRSSKK